MALTVPTLAEMNARGETPEVLFVGCSCSSMTGCCASPRYRPHPSRGRGPCRARPAESAPATRPSCRQRISSRCRLPRTSWCSTATALRIVTSCPHCFNTPRTNTPNWGEYEVCTTHSIQQLIDDGRLRIADGNPSRVAGSPSTTPATSAGATASTKPRAAPASWTPTSPKCALPQKGLCCGAGGAQMFKDAEKGNREVNHERTDDVLETGAKVIATG